MTTGESSTFPIIVFAKTRDGARVPLQASVSPLRNQAGEIVGGVESFRDISHELADIQRAKRIQDLALQFDLREDPRIKFTQRYVPHDVIGGDYLAIAALTPHHYGFLLADVTGHGVPAALYTMFLSSLWSSYRDLLLKPVDFARVVGNRLEELIQESSSPFAAALCGVFDLARGEMRLVGAGNPAPLIRRADGTWEVADS
jgi:serine phosphatase RsbU (regulator of sigma subunit)